MNIVDAKLAIRGIAMAVLVLFAWLVWPTVYRYDSMTVGPTHLAVRIHRITGRAEALRLNGWAEITVHPESGRQTSQELSEDELRKLSGTAQITNYGWIKAQIYNGTDNPVREVTLEALVRNQDGGIAIDRRYALTST